MKKTDALSRFRVNSQPIAEKRKKSSLTASEITSLLTLWKREARVAEKSQRTIDEYERLISTLLWFMAEHNDDCCNGDVMIRYLEYCSSFIDDELLRQGIGRWGCELKYHRESGTPLSSLSKKTYYSKFRAFFNWVIGKRLLDVSPLADIPSPSCQPWHTTPVASFTEDDIKALTKAASKSQYAARNTAILLMFYDTGLRVAELAKLRYGDLDPVSQSITFRGKGNKLRTVHYGKEVANALWIHRNEGRKGGVDENSLLFAAQRGTTMGEGLTESGLRQIIKKLGARVGILNKRCSPHTFRHSFAIQMLNNGAHLASVRDFLGQTDIRTTQRYLHASEADLAAQHMQFSPADNLTQRKRARK